jgi:hypothetical protein
MYRASQKLLKKLDKGIKMRCNHISCGNKKKIWLPHKYQGLECGLKPHLYCEHCGMVKIASSDRPKRLGYYINVIADISKEFKVAKVQIRLISIELQRQGIDDIYSIDKSMQEKIFVEIVQKYISLPEQAIRQFL